MPPEKPWGPCNPNSQHQRWSRWTFELQSDPHKHPAQDYLCYHFKHWCATTFGTAGQAMADEFVHTHNRTKQVVARGYILMAEVEGPPVHDPEYVVSVRREFRAFVDRHWSPRVTFTMDTALLAGDAEDGRPPAQLIVLPTIPAS